MARRGSPTRTTRRLIRATVVGALVAGSLTIAPPASACSCAPPEFPQRLDEADGAFVGTWVDRAVILGGQAAVTFEVERVLKGGFGPRAIVRTEARGSACGLELLGTARTGLLLERAGDGVWTSDLCSMVPATELLAAASGQPPDPAIAPVGVGWSVGSIVTLLVAGLAVAVVGIAVGVRRREGRGAPASDVP
jgi:hypothetical protein